jgi:cytochrome c5
MGRTGVRVRGVAALAGAMTLAAALMTSACSPEDPQDRGTLEMPAFADDRLAAGRSVWMGTCRACHLLGVAGAPAVTDAQVWGPRLDKGREALYRSALNGIRGEDGKYRMPPRGGNKRLTEQQVRLAVDYKLAAIERLKTRNR